MTKIVIGGDVFLKKDHKIHENSSVFEDSDFNIVNLEAPAGGKEVNKQISKKSGPNLLQNPRHVINLFSELNIRYVVGANNHIWDFGETGIRQTIDFLNKEKIEYAGFGANTTEAEKPMRLESTNVYILSAGEEEFGVASNKKSGYLSIYGDDILETIKRLKEKNMMVIVCPHGGGEDVPLPSQYIYRRYRDLIDAGADIVIAHHPHVPQGYEKYKGRYIFYSVGNFIHDSYKKSWGLVVNILIDKNKVAEVQPLAINVSPQKAVIGQLSESQENYLKSINLILENNSTYESMLQTQAVDMYQDYYNKYIERILVLKRGGFFSKKDDKEIIENRELLFLNLIRNKSHSEFIERALKVIYSEVEDLRNKRNEAEYFRLKSYIKKNFN